MAAGAHVLKAAVEDVEQKLGDGQLHLEAVGKRFGNGALAQRNLVACSTLTTTSACMAVANLSGRRAEVRACRPLFSHLIYGTDLARNLKSEHPWRLR